jgi:hypothetical protein
VWQLWKKHELIEQEGLRGLLAFTEPHFHLPFLITALSTFFGLLFTFTLWGDIKPGFRVLVALVTPVGCLLSLQGVYEGRLSIRRRELLRQVKRGWSKGPGISTLTVSIPAVALGLVLAFTLVLVKVDILWELVAWLALIEAPEAGGTFPEKLQAVMPFTSLIAYLALATSFTASSALMLAWQYMNQLNEFLPLPIFLQDEELTQIIRREAEVELGRLDPEELRERYPESANISLMGYLQFEEQADLQLLQLPASVDMSTAIESSLSPQVALWGQAATWTWDELERTNDGGIEMTVARQDIYQLPESQNSERHRPHPSVRYVVRANHWGRITKIKREEVEED